ncbi:hypothetical protein E4K10_18235 [Streptomyces sp. T1317-0309]|nr:hypothetical protein E4K10_18235 [Streptomyces sp. T1317-0309]
MYGQAAGALFKNAIVDNYEEGAETIKESASAGLIPPGATMTQIQSIGTSVHDLATALGTEVPDAAAAAGALVKKV